MREAVREAAVHRLRPILLTALAAILAMIPLTRSTFWGPMAWAIMGGLMVATILTLIVLPALALFVSTVGPAWGWTHVDAIVTTLNALGILAGALIGVSAIKQRLDLAA